MVKVRSKIAVLTVAALFGAGLTSAPANAATDNLGAVYFSGRSSILSPSAKKTLGALKSKIAKTDTITATGYIRNHQNISPSVGLNRANAVKNYLVSIGVKAKVKVVNGGILKKGGSVAAANKVTITKVKGKTTNGKGTYKLGVALGVFNNDPTILQAICNDNGLALNAELTPVKGKKLTGVGHASYDSSSGVCHVQATVSGLSAGDYMSKILLVDKTQSDLLTRYVIAADQGDGVDRTDMNLNPLGNVAFEITMESPLTSLGNSDPKSGVLLNHIEIVNLAWD